MPWVKFIEAWRGHEFGAIADLTDKRAAELIREKVCQPLDKPAPDTEPVLIVKPKPVPKPKRAPRIKRAKPHIESEIENGDTDK